MATFESRAASILDMHQGVFGQSLERNPEMEDFTWLAENWLTGALFSEMGELGRNLQNELYHLITVSGAANHAALVADTAQYDRQKFGKAQILEAKELEGRFLLNEKSANVEAQKRSDQVLDVWTGVKAIAVQILEHFARQLEAMEAEATITANAHKNLAQLDDEGFEEVADFKSTHTVLFDAKEEQQAKQLTRLQETKTAVATRLTLLQSHGDEYEALAFQSTAPSRLDPSLAIPLAA